MTTRHRFNTYGAATVDREKHVIYGASAMQAVEALGHRLLIDHTTLQQFVDKANEAKNGLKSRFTHPGLSADGMGKLLGRMRNFRIEGDKAIGDLYLSESAAKSPHGDLRAYIESLAVEDPESFGLSVVVDGYGVWVLDDGTEEESDYRPDRARDKFRTLRIVEAYAVDAVDEPAANRDGLFSAFRGTTSELAAAVYKTLDSYAGVTNEIERFIETGEMRDEFRQLADEYDIDADKARIFAAHYLERRGRHPARITLAAKAAITESVPMEEKVVSMDAAVEKPAAVPQVDEWEKARRQHTAATIIQASNLPAAVQARLLKGEYDSPVQVEAAIAEARAELAALQEANVVQIGGKAPRGIHVYDAADEAADIVNWFFGVDGAKTPASNMRRFDQLYVALTGDAEFRGLFDPTRVMFASATTATLPNLAADAMNKVIIQHMVRMDHWRWFERIVDVVPNNGTLQDINLITLGGLSNLPIVAEGAAYIELAVDDAEEEVSFVKRGGYVGITREMIKNSNLMQLQAIPRALANAAVRTRSAAVSAIFTANAGVGPTLAQDSTALFHANHGGNVQVTAFGTDATAWRAARAECFQMTELNSGAVLGIFPRFALLPAELYDVALSVFGYGEGMPTTYSPEAQDRGFADPRPIPIVVPDWTDATDWAYIVDPALFPVIQMSYSQNPGGRSHPAPELFSVVSETSGLLFTNDTLPIKVRDEFAVGVNGWRGIGKRNVAG